uniref:Uncharacterized protein n=1 Tax=Setaria viridis TaxID=4556 RepID=A0A4U6SUS5_SETVI|nr:hypothetical protein SEVIR_9G176250v2 [Setaria viridis]
MTAGSSGQAESELELLAPRRRRPPHPTKSRRPEEGGVHGGRRAAVATTRCEEELAGREGRELRRRGEQRGF